MLQSVGNFTRAIGTGAGEVQWGLNTAGGFAAYSSPLVVNFSGGSASFGLGGIGNGTGTLILSSVTALSDVTIASDLNLNGAVRTIQVDDNTSTFLDYATITGVISGSVGSGLTKTGGGLLYLTGANTYSGNTNINAGQIAVMSIGGGSVASSAFGDGSGQINLNAGYLLYAGAGETTVRRINLASGNSTIESSGSGALIINNVVNSGAGSKTLTLRGFSNDVNVISSVLADNGGSLRLAKADGGTWMLSGANTFTGGVRIDAGLLALGNSQSLGAVGPTGLVAAAVAASTTVVLASGTTDNLVVGMNISGNGIAYGDTVASIVNSTTFTISSTRTIPVNSSLVFGGLLISNGGIYATDPAGLTLSQPLTINTNTAAIFTGVNSITLNGKIGGTPGNPWTITNTIATPGTLTINGNLESYENATARNFNFVGTGNTYFNGTLVSAVNATSPVGLVYNTSGTVTLGGSVAAGAGYVNGTTINQGTVIVSKAGSLNPFGTANVLAMPAGTLQSTVDLTGANALVTPLQLTNVYGVISGTSSIQFAGNLTQGYSLQNNGGNRAITNNLSGGAVLTFSTQPVNLTNDTTGRTLTIAGSGNTNITSVVQNGGTGASGLTYAGTGTMSLTGLNTATGSLTANRGVVSLNGAAGAWSGGGVAANATGILRLDNSVSNNTNRVLNTGAVTLAGGRLDFIGNSSGSTETFGALTLNAVDSTITMSGAGSNTLTFASVSFANTGSSLDLSGITGLGGTNKIMFTTAPTAVPATSGILARVFLNGGNDFATYNHDGVAANTNGVQAMIAGGYVTTNDMNAAAATATMNLTASPAALTAAKTLNALKINGNGLTIGSNNGFVMTLTAAAILNTGGNNTLAQTNTAFGGNTGYFQIKTGTTLNVTGALTGTNGMALAGGGTLKLSSPTFITLTTNILNGTLQLAGGLNSMYPNQILNVDLGGVLDLNGNTQYVGQFQSSGVVPNSGGIVTSSSGTGTFITNMNGGSTTFAGQITGAVNFVRLGGNTLTLESAQTYTGATILMGGTVTLQDSATLMDTSSITLNYATLAMDNNIGLWMDNANRIGDSVAITMRGGALSFNGLTNSNSSEVVGEVTSAQGANTITSSVQAVGTFATANLTLSNLTRNLGTTVNFTTSNGTLGSQGTNPRILVTGGIATQTNGAIGAWAIVNGTDYASYNPSQGIGALGAAGYASYTSTFDSGNATEVFGGPTTVTLSGNTSTGLLRLAGNYNSDIAFTPGAVLNLEQGGLLRGNNAAAGSTIGTEAVRGVLTAGGAATLGTSELIIYNTNATAAQTGYVVNSTVAGSSTVTLNATTNLSAGMLITGPGIPVGTIITAVLNATQVTISSPATSSNNGGSFTGTANLTIHSVIANSGAGTSEVALVKSGTGLLTLTGANTYTGGTTVNQGTLALNGAASTVVIPEGGLTINGGIVNMLINGGQIESSNVVTLNGNSTLNLVGSNSAHHCHDRRGQPESGLWNDDLRHRRTNGGFREWWRNDHGGSGLHDHQSGADHCLGDDGHGHHQQDRRRLAAIERSEFLQRRLEHQ
ncbi:MAG: hypothetical protein B7Z47_02930 [Chthoniobacter sp. 12-60-6]|nr:MAG: hypothetical protein B7Z47_02930 [Chthoniobacter sp. 12-60-6]